MKIKNIIAGVISDNTEVSESDADWMAGEILKKIPKQKKQKKQKWDWGQLTLNEIRKKTKNGTKRLVVTLRLDLDQVLEELSSNGVESFCDFLESEISEEYGYYLADIQYQVVGGGKGSFLLQVSADAKELIKETKDVE